MAIPAAYQGREQSYLKHLVLEQYLELWGHKLGSNSRHGGKTLWYVDCFSGPWSTSSDDLRDTSVCIGLNALEKAGETWRKQGYEIGLQARFIEKEPRAFKRLEEYLAGRNGTVFSKALRGEFGQHVELIDREIGRDPAFLFIDPTGWKGVPMRYIAPLARTAKRDVLINVMTSQLQRWPNADIGWLRDQLRDFFGLDEEKLQQLADAPTLMEVYRNQLKAKCGVRFAADLAIPHPIRRMTHFRLVVGGHSPWVLRVFRDVEWNVCGKVAGIVREEAKRNRTKQGFLLPPEEGPSREYEEEHEGALEVLPDAIVSALRGRGGQMQFADLWPGLLEAHHLRFKDVTDCLATMRDVIDLGLGPRKRIPEDTTVIRLR